MPECTCCGGCLVLLSDAGGDVSTIAHRDSLRIADAGRSPVSARADRLGGLRVGRHKQDGVLAGQVVG